MHSLNSWWWWPTSGQRSSSHSSCRYSIVCHWFVVLVFFHVLWPTSTNSKGINNNLKKEPRTTSSASHSSFDAQDTRLGTSATSATSISSKPHNRARETVDAASLPSITSWVAQHCRKPGNEFYSEVPLSFIKDPVTTATICDSINSPFVDDAIKLINGDVSDPAELCSSKREAIAINALAEHLYDLLHGRYIITYEGLRSVRQKHERGVYGQCPRVFCRGYPLLPVGLHDRAKESTVKCFCSKCRDIYQPPSLRHRRIDSAAFGTTLPHLLLQRMPEVSPAGPMDRYIPRLFGFEIHESATEMMIYRERYGVRGERINSRGSSGKEVGTTTTATAAMATTATAGTGTDSVLGGNDDQTIMNENDDLP